MKKRCISFLLAALTAGSYICCPVCVQKNDYSAVYAAEKYHMSEYGIELIKGFEGFTRYAQWDYAQWSIGYGTGVEKDAYPNGISEAEADRLLRNVVHTFENYVQTFLDKYNLTVTQNQYDALVSFTYNMGNVWVNKSEVTIRTYLINGIQNYTPQQITDAFKLWCKAGGEVLPGLVRRRETEAALFLSDLDYTTKAEKGEKWRINSSTGVRLRNSYGTQEAIISVIPYNQTFQVEEKVEADGFLWGKTNYSGMTGWCVLDYADYISGKAETTVIADGDRYEQWKINAATGVNLRYNYGMENKVLAVLPYETVFTVYEKKKTDDCLWGRTEYAGEVGWLVLNYAKKLGAEEKPEKLVVKTLPKKMEYIAGELFDGRGMTISAVYSDGREEITEEYGCTGNTMIPGISTIKVEYMGASAEFNVVISPQKGDINKNGTIDMEDDLNIKYFLLDKRDDDVQELGDINGDGTVNVLDSIRIKNSVLRRTGY